MLQCATRCCIIRAYVVPTNKAPPPAGVLKPSLITVHLVIKRIQSKWGGDWVLQYDRSPADLSSVEVGELLIAAMGQGARLTS